MTNLPERALGSLKVSAIGLGCMNLSHAYGLPPSSEEGGRLLNRALDLGVTLLDTAALYGGGSNETLLGASVMHRRREFTLASKCVLGMYDGKRGLDGSPGAIAQTLDEALVRLRTDHIDLYYLHRLDRRVPIEESVGALVRAKEAGKIGAIGLSEMSAATIARAHAVHPIAAVQSEYSPMGRNPEVAVLETCARLGIGFVAFSPVARGMLAASVRDDAYAPGDIRMSMPRFRQPNLAHNLIAVQAFEALAAETGCTPAQLALAWLLARGDTIVPIPGTRSIAHLEENVAAAAIVLEPATIAQIDGMFAGDAIRGARYAASAQAQVDTELLPDEELAAD
ncbi:aldo/keto reductase [Sphingomonas sp. M1-B02]|uniref:aldo/keto reductase n=1 Tax=Sphingomonas sp. M1-B02 TaxID=3114300 RepID=UPI00223F150E|nr:aldo/keto reductase [Sphingomonas sp. S6-11]UZK65193.1 aldo/keto reductase [Sphingomonas sp. S6-11]